MSKKSLSKDQQLIREARQYFDFSELFPRTKIDARKPLTKYQKGKLKSSIDEAISKAGNSHYLQRDFIPMRKSKSRAEYNDALGMPKGFRGVTIQGGAKTNREAHFERGTLLYKRGKSETFSHFKPVNAKTERLFTSSLKKVSKEFAKQGKFHFIALGTASGEIKTYAAKADDTEGLQEFQRKSVQLYNQYVSMAGNGEKRSNGRWAAHPNKWGLGIMGLKSE